MENLKNCPCCKKVLDKNIETDNVCLMYNFWVNSTPQEKLEVYHVKGLQNLAKKKNLKGYSLLSKKDLILKLADILNESDLVLIYPLTVMCDLWVKSTPKEKLDLYNVRELKILAKNKKLKNYSRLKRPELIKILSDIVDENDFPIYKKC